MRRILKLVILSVGFCLLLSVKANAGTIIVNLEGIKTSKGGKVFTAVFVKQTFLKFGQHLFGNIKAVSASQTQIVFEGVPAGTYGIATFQDTDGSEDLSKNFLGIPTEPMGFSRNPRIMFGPPDFEEAEISLKSNETVQITINLK